MVTLAHLPILLEDIDSTSSNSLIANSSGYVLVLLFIVNYLKKTCLCLFFSLKFALSIKDPDFNSSS